MGRIGGQEHAIPGTLKGARLRQRGWSLKFTSIRIRRIRPERLLCHRCRRTRCYSIVAHTPQAQGDSPYRTSCSRNPPWSYVAHSLAWIARRRAGMAGRDQGTARKTSEPTTAPNHRQRLECWAFPFSLDRLIHTQSDRPSASSIQKHAVFATIFGVVRAAAHPALGSRPRRQSSMGQMKLRASSGTHPPT